MSDPLDILTEDLSSAPTGFPLLSEALYDLNIKEVKDEPTRDGSKTVLSIELATTENAVSADGETLYPGVTVWHTITLTPSEKNTPDAIKRRVAEFVQAAGMKTIKPYEQFQGKVVRAKVTIEAESTDKVTGKKYPAKNRIGNFLIPGKTM